MGTKAHDEGKSDFKRQGDAKKVLDNGKVDTYYTRKDLETILRRKFYRKGHSKLKEKPASLKNYHKVNNVEVEVVLDPGKSEPIEIYLPGIDEKIIGRVEYIKAE